MSKADIRKWIAQQITPEWRIVEVEWISEWLKDPHHPRKNPRQRFAKVKVKHRKRRSVQRKFVFVTKAGRIGYGTQESVRRPVTKKKRAKRGPIALASLRATLQAAERERCAVAAAPAL